MTCEPHEWEETGRRDRSLAGVLWTWLKCRKCGADGFRRGESAVSYCWEPCHAVIIP